MKVTKICAECGETIELEVSAEIARKIENGGVTPDDVKDLNVFEQRALLNSKCFDCQELEFGMPAPGNEEAWGELIGTCPCCDRPIWSNHTSHEEDALDSDTMVYECDSCGIFMTKVEDEMMEYAVDFEDEDYDDDDCDEDDYDDDDDEE